jgi:hypothetical protein
MTTAKLTRGYIVGLVLGFACAPAIGAPPCAGFADVDDESPFCESVQWIKNQSITLGCAPGLYCPTEPVSRLQLAAFLRRMDKLLPPRWVDSSGRLVGAHTSSNFVWWQTPHGPVRLRVDSDGFQRAASSLEPESDQIGLVYVTQACTGQPYLSFGVPFAPMSFAHHNHPDPQGPSLWVVAPHDPQETGVGQPLPGNPARGFTRLGRFSCQEIDIPEGSQWFPAVSLINVDSELSPPFFVR